MKKQYNKSEIMSQAWELYRENEMQNEDNLGKSFSYYLAWSWRIAKDNYSIEQEPVNVIFAQLENQDVYFNHILKVVSENSKGFQADIAAKVMTYGRMSTKQMWCVAYEFKNVA